MLTLLVGLVADDVVGADGGELGIAATELVDDRPAPARERVPGRGVVLGRDAPRTGPPRRAVLLPVQPQDHAEAGIGRRLHVAAEFVLQLVVVVVVAPGHPFINGDDQPAPATVHHAHECRILDTGRTVRRETVEIRARVDSLPVCDAAGHEGRPHQTDDTSSSHTLRAHDQTSFQFPTRLSKSPPCPVMHNTHDDRAASGMSVPKSHTLARADGHEF